METEGTSASSQAVGAVSAGEPAAEGSGQVSDPASVASVANEGRSPPERPSATGLAGAGAGADDDASLEELSLRVRLARKQTPAWKKSNDRLTKVVREIEQELINLHLKVTVSVDLPAASDGSFGGAVTFEFFEGRFGLFYAATADDEVEDEEFVRLEEVPDDDKRLAAVRALPELVEKMMVLAERRKIEDVDQAHGKTSRLVEIIRGAR